MLYLLSSKWLGQLTLTYLINNSSEATRTLIYFKTYR